MEIIVEENCENRESIIFMIEQMKEYLNKIVVSYCIDSLGYFVIADSTIENYCESVKKYAKNINSETVLTNDDDYNVAGKTIDGINDAGEYQQAIIIKSMLVVAMYKDLLRNTQTVSDDSCDMGTLNNTGLVTVIHEMGHAIDDLNIYKLRGKVDCKVLFDLSKELDEYLEKVAYSLWGEYYAESFPYRILESKFTDVVDTGKEENLIECIKSYSKEKKRNAIVERVYRILYFFVHCLSSMHFRKQQSFDYAKYEKDSEINIYIPYLASVEIELIHLLENYPDWDKNNCMVGLSEKIRDMIDFEIEQ